MTEKKNTITTTTTRVQTVRTSGEGEEQSHFHLPECSDRHSLCLQARQSWGHSPVILP